VPHLQYQDQLGQLEPRELLGLQGLQAKQVPRVFKGFRVQQELRGLLEKLDLREYKGYRDPLG
jgi:hypothetical protein